MTYYQDLPVEYQNTIFETLKERLKQDAEDQGYDTNNGDHMIEFVDDYINCNNTKENVREWVNEYCL